MELKDLNEDDFYKQVGRRISKMRNMYDYIQQDLGDILDKTRQTIHNYETGKRRPSLSDLIKIATAFDQPVGYFLGMKASRDFECPICEGKKVIEIPCYCQRERY